MIELTNFEVQNSVITPAALALNEARPRTIHDQKWILVLTGAVDAHLRGSDDGPLEQEVHVLPDILSSCRFAINKYSIPRPPGVEGFQYNVAFEPEMWAPFVALGPTSNQDSDVAITGVPNWSMSFITGVDSFTGNSIPNVFNGLAVTCDVSDSDVIIWGISYNISLVGKIVFTRVQIT